MKLVIVTSTNEVIIRSRLATKYDSAYIKGLSSDQIQELEQFVGNSLEKWHVSKFWWDEEVKEQRVDE
jgi:hypothetical protein